MTVLVYYGLYEAVERYVKQMQRKDSGLFQWQKSNDKKLRKAYIMYGYIDEIKNYCPW